MAEQVSISELPPVPWVRERDVDLLLAELLSTEPSLTSWLLDRELRRDAEVPVGVPSIVRAVVNYSRPEARGGATGETDVVTTAEYDDGDMLLLSIEDKVWAAPQRHQGQRHRTFVEGHGARWGLAVLIGPDQWIGAHSDEASEYHLTVALEDLAQWCEDHDFEFQASVFRQACVPRDFALAPDLQDWHTAVDNLLDEEFGLRLAPQRYVRTRNQGKARPNRWASCEIGTLTPISGVGQPWITLKPASANHPARAVIECVKAPTALVEAVSMRARDRGFAVRVTRSGTLLIEQHVLDAMGWTVADPFDDQVIHVRAVGRAAVELREWWNGSVSELEEVLG